MNFLKRLFARQEKEKKNDPGLRNVIDLAQKTFNEEGCYFINYDLLLNRNGGYSMLGAVLHHTMSDDDMVTFSYAARSHDTFYSYANRMSESNISDSMWHYIRLLNSQEDMTWEKMREILETHQV